MDENKPRRRWLSFGIRDLLWAMVVVALLLGAWVAPRNAQVQETKQVQAGRFQLVNVKEGVAIVFDTATGRQWIRYSDTGPWIGHASPYDAADD